jgi:hypothetical protein
MTYACPVWEFAVDSHLLKLQRLQNKNPPHHWLPTKAHTDPRFTSDVANSVRLRLYNKGRKQAEVIQNHDNVYVRKT